MADTCDRCCRQTVTARRAARPLAPVVAAAGHLSGRAHAARAVSMLLAAGATGASLALLAAALLGAAGLLPVRVGAVLGLVAVAGCMAGVLLGAARAVRLTDADRRR